MISEGARAAYLASRASGMSQESAALAAGISRASGAKLEVGRNKVIGSGGHGSGGGRGGRAIPARSGNGNPWADRHNDDDPEPIPLELVVPEAREALENFGLFRTRYLARGPSPWQEDAGERILDLLLSAQASRDREYVVLNAPPGAGKSTLWHDVCVWLICRDRRIRILYGSRTTGQATKYTGRIRRTLMQRSPVVPRDEDVARGLAVPAAASLVEDFGRFRPVSKAEAAVWQQGGFIVAQPDGALADEKEPTVTAFGFDADYLGMRVDLAIWDDLVDMNQRTNEVMDSLKEIWDLVAEPRIDPGGVNVLQGQRLRHNDLYRYNLDKLRARDEEVEDKEDDELTEGDFVPKYHHIVYRAHDENHCTELHKRSDPPWRPDGTGGCLLEPRRIPWRDLKTLMAQHPDVFAVVYQQEDLDPASQLIQKIWVDGGRDDRGTHYPGCWDDDRVMWERPPEAECQPPFHLALVVDPSPSNWWAVQLWWYQPASEKRYLIALERRRMDASEFLDWDRGRLRFTGFLEEWWTRCQDDLGVPLRHIVVETNIAQKWLLSYNHAVDWAIKRGVNFTRHQTGVWRIDDDQGIPSVKQLWKTGRIRLPGGDAESKAAAGLLVNELLHWTKATRKDNRNHFPDDQVMAHWFFEFTLPKLFAGKTAQGGTQRRPSWLGDGVLAVPDAWHRVFGRKGA